MTGRAEHWFSIISIAVIVVIVFASSVDHSVQKEDRYNRQVIEMKTGEEIPVGNLTYRINQTQFRKTILNDFYPKTAEGIFLIVNVTVRNVSDRACLLDSACFKLTDHFGSTYEVAYEGSIALDESDEHTLSMKKCKPQSTLTGLLCFDVPQKDEYNLLLKDGSHNSPLALVKLKCKNETAPGKRKQK